MIKITKDNIFVVDTISSDLEKSISTKEIVRFLSESISIDDDVLFERIFEIIIDNKSIFNEIYASTLGFYTIDDFVLEYTKDHEEHKDERSEIDYLEVRRYYDIWESDEENEIASYEAFHGICENFTDEYQKEPIQMGISVGFTPINELKKYPIKINNEIEIKKFDLDSKKYIDYLNGRSEITVFEFFQAILNEISFYGSPSERDEVLDKLKLTTQQFESGELKTYELISNENGFFLKDENGELKPFFGSSNKEE